MNVIYYNMCALYKRSHPLTSNAKINQTLQIYWNPKPIMQYIEFSQVEYNRLD